MYVSTWGDSDKTMPAIRKKIMRSISQSTYFGFRGVGVYSNPKMLTKDYLGTVVEITTGKYVWVKEDPMQAKIIMKSGELGKKVNAQEYVMLKKELNRK